MSEATQKWAERLRDLAQEYAEADPVEPFRDGRTSGHKFVLLDESAEPVQLVVRVEEATK